MMKQFKSFVCWLIVSAAILSLIDRFAIPINWMIWSFPLAGILQIAVHFALKYFLERHPYNDNEVRRIKGRFAESSESVFEKRHNTVPNIMNNQRKLYPISRKPMRKTKKEEETVVELPLKDSNPDMGNQVEQISFDPSTEKTILNSFITMYEHKFVDRAKKVQPALEMADDYIKKNFAEYYKNASGYSTIQVYNMNAKILYEKISSGTSFKEDILSFRGEPDEEERKKLQKICDVLNGRGIAHLVTRGYTVERFKLQSEYRPEERRFINKEGDIWIYFMGCTDGTHAPAGFRESEWFMFYYKGFAAELHFEEQFTAPRTFKLKIAFVKGYHIAEMSELNTILHEKGILVEKYYQLLREALDASRPYSPNYYVF